MCIVSEVKCTSSFTMSFGETFFVIFFNSSWCLSNISLDWSNMDWRLVSICLSLSMNFDKNLFVISFSTWVSSDIFSVSYLRITSSFITIFDHNVLVFFPIIRDFCQMFCQAKKTWLGGFCQDTYNAQLVVFILNASIFRLVCQILDHNEYTWGPIFDKIGQTWLVFCCQSNSLK